MKQLDIFSQKVVITREQQEMCWAEAKRIRGQRDDSPTCVRTPAKGRSMLYNEYGALCAEQAVATFLGVEWTPSKGPNREQGDVAGCEVRWTIYPTGHLFVHPYDDPMRPVIFVTGEPPEMEIRGWMLIGDAQRQDWWDSDLKLPAYRVPRDYQLEPMDKL